MIVLQKHAAALTYLMVWLVPSALYVFTVVQNRGKGQSKEAEADLSVCFDSIRLDIAFAPCIVFLAYRLFVA
jgi:hypothetical protein